MNTEQQTILVKRTSSVKEYAIIEYTRFDGNKVKRRFDDAEKLMALITSLLVNKRKFNVQHYEGDGYPVLH